MDTQDTQGCFPWHLLSFGYLELLNDRLSVFQGGALGGTVDGIDFPNLPWRDLLKSRLVNGGYARLVTTLPALVLGRKVEALRLVEPTFGSYYGFPAWLKDWLGEEDPVASPAAYMECADFLEGLGLDSALEVAFVLAFSENTEKTPERYLSFVIANDYYGCPEIEPYPDGISPVFLGRKFSSRFGKDVVDPDHFFKRVNIEIISGNIATAESMLAEAATRSKEAFFLCRVSAMWVTMLNNRVMGLDVLQQAEKLVDERRLIACPWTSWQLFGDKEGARTMMEFYVDSVDWSLESELLQADGVMDFANLYTEVGQSRAYLATILQQVGEYVQNTEECIRCANLASGHLQDEPFSRSLTRRAESFVDKIDDWYDIILKYSIEERTSDVARCLALAMEQARSFFEWAYLAGMVRHTSSDIDLFKQCMKKAEALAETPANWRSCSESWETYFSKDEASRCSRRAAELEKSTKS